MNGFVMMLAAFATGGWVGSHLNGTVWPLVQGVLLWSVVLGATSWTAGTKNLENRDMLPEHLPNIALAGPTASGKTAGALALAAVLGRRMPVEIISVDSALVYRAWTLAPPNPRRQSALPCPTTSSTSATRCRPTALPSLCKTPRASLPRSAPVVPCPAGGRHHAVLQGAAGRH